MTAVNVSRHGRLLTPYSALILLSLAIVVVATASFTSAIAASDLYVLGAALLLAAGGFCGETLLMLARRDLLERPLAPDAERESSGFLQGLLNRFAESVRRLRAQQSRHDWIDTWLPIALAFSGSLLALLTVYSVWPSTTQIVADGTHLPLLGGVLIVLAFPLLVLNRIYARLADIGVINAPALERLLRIPLLACIGLGSSALIRSVGYSWPYLIERLIIIVIAVVAVEIILRSLARLFLPMPMLASRDVGMSSVAGFLQPAWPRRGALNIAIKRQFGIDLSRSWAAAFLLRAATPVLVALLFFGWLLTGVTTLDINQRGIYERFGQPVFVLGPGLHLHLPWPFGIVRRVELGVVHEIPIVFSAENSMQAASSAPEEQVTIGAEDVPPPSVDRLWDDQHPSEASYLIASSRNGLEGFEIVNIDLRVVYRIRPDDQAAMSAMYRVADPEDLIRASAGRMLVQHFSQYTLTDVLGENRAAFIRSFRSELQQRLDELQTGTDIIAVVVEAIHPPPAAARAYHNVQASQIKALALVSQSRGNAFIELGQARQLAATTLSAATAQASEQIHQATAADTLFTGDFQAHQRGGYAFLREQWLGHIQKDLVRSPLLVLDHRLTSVEQPTVDLRKFEGPGVATPVIPVK